MTGPVSPRHPRRLPCGRDLDRLTDQVLERTPPADPEHQDSCPHCRAALAELRQLWSPVHEMADEQVEAPPDLVDRVMTEIRSLDGSGEWAVIPGEQGDTAIAVHVIAVIARRAADSQDGALMTMTRAEHGVEVSAVGRSLVLRLDLVAAYGVDLMSLTERIRRTVQQHVAALTGLRVVAVDVDVVEMVDPGGYPPS